MPLLGVLLVVLIGAGVFLLLNKDDTDEATPTATPTTVAAATTAPPDQATTPTDATPTSEAATTVAPGQEAPSTTAAPAGTATLTPTQQRELCHLAFVGTAEGKTDTGDPLDACTSQDWINVGREVSIFLHGDPNQDRSAMLKSECDTRRAAGASPKACEGI